MADAYRLASLSAGSAHSNGGQPSEAGPSNMQTQSASAGVKRKSNSTANGRKKRASGTEDSGDGQSASAKARDGPKKKKAARACFHCQKAHLTCDDARPCQRCTKRGMADQCTEGHRKKAKYLLDDGELEALKRSKSHADSVSEENQPPVSTPQSATTQPYSATDSIFSVPFDPSYSFGSEAANLEYSSLSALLGLGNYGADNAFVSPENPPSNQYGPQQFANASWPAEPSQQQIMPQQPYSGVPAPNAYDMGFANPQNGQYISQQQYGASSLATPPTDQQMQMQIAGQMPPNVANRYPTPDLGYPSISTQPSQSFTPQPQQPPQHSIPRHETPSTLNAPSITSRPSNQSVSSLVSPPTSDSPVSATSVYHAITKAYDYTESYHFLMKFLPTRFGKIDILRVIRALAIYRPSIISLQSTMSDDDFVFMEKCLRRSLVELDKLISFSGTPTVVWRRTGEILLAGAEFCLLTEWNREDLLTGRKYIYELFENQSIVEYWEKFASHAFENTTQSVYSHCVLLKPSGEPIPCTFCFSIRRDIFDLPSVVIGTWSS
ncbi:hypothetical protein SCHPADRAFT_879599 [Schizopora paradoxa]|uniref:Transcription activator of gluconeogenesis ERT1 n=1 Tax=Schizopora paradoxa TaxID=27342 RepID=A0A0H2RWP3_9AGAM|nr:hypothetical protein SCHPADRAFT_879599 [Schizopora paradoxa]